MNCCYFPFLLYNYLQHRRCSLLLVFCALPLAMSFILSLVQWDAAYASQEVVEDHVGAEDILTEPDHTTARHSGQSGILQVLYLKHYTHLEKGKSGFIQQVLTCLDYKETKTVKCFALTFGGKLRRSPLGRVSSLLSSRTELRF